MNNIIRHTEGQYTNINQKIFRDTELSYKAKGLLCQMFSLPVDWEYSVVGLSQLAKDGKDSVRNAITELEEAGYLYRQEVRDKGRICGYRYHVYDTRGPFPSAVEPSAGFPPTANTAQSITKESTTKKSITKNTNNRGNVFIPPTVDEVREYCYQRQNNIDPESFVDFYASKGWMVGKSKMKDWKAAVRTWERNRKGSQQSTGNPYIDMLKEGRF